MAKAQLKTKSDSSNRRTVKLSEYDALEQSNKELQAAIKHKEKQVTSQTKEIADLRDRVTILHSENLRLNGRIEELENLIEKWRLGKSA